MIPLALAFDGEIADANEVGLSPLDRTVAFGDGLFETLRVVGTTPQHVARHLGRLQRSAAQLQLRLPPETAIGAASERVIAAARATGCADDLRLKWLFSRGIASWTAAADAAAAPHWFVMAHRGAPPPPSLRLALVDLPLPQRRLPALKATSYLDSLVAKQMALAAGADEAMRLDWQGGVAEGAAVNLFAIKGNVLYTAPALGIVPGIVREIVLELAPYAGLEVRQEAVTLEAFRGADEWFASNALIGVCPVVAADGHARPVGRYVQALMLLYAQQR